MIFFKHLSIMLVLLTFTHASQALNPAEATAWIEDPAAKNQCGGYFKEPLLLPQKQANKGTTVKSQRAEGILGNQIHLSGNVNIYQEGKLLKAKQAKLYKNPKNKQIQKIILDGNVSIQQVGRRLIGTHSVFWRNQSEKKITKGYINEPWYRFAQNNSKTSALHHWGHARLMKQLSENYYRFYDASYATCPPNKNIWALKTEQLDFDQINGIAYATNSTLNVKGVPVFYWPYFSYPINKKRRTGFLLPAYNVSSQSGGDLSLPLYLNLSPNYDATIVPHYLSLRGLLSEMEARYLNRRSNASLQFAYINHDDKFSSLKHNLSQQNISVHSLGNQRLGGKVHADLSLSPQWQTKIDYQAVSDDYFYRDLSSSLLSDSPRHLNQSIETHYEHYFPNQIQLWKKSKIDFILKRFQTLHPHDERAVLDQYGVLPQISTSQTFGWKQLHLDLNLQATQFKWPHRAIADRVDGRRFMFEPQISYSYQPDYGFFIPTLAARFTQYHLNNPNDTLSLTLQPVPERASLSIPYFTIDTGLYFDKKLSTRYQQTVTPRLMYVQIPYKNQNNFPLFDTGLNQFSASYLWEPNRFTGHDRLGDSRHLSYGLSSEWQDQALSQTVLKLSLGQIHYFDKRRLSFCYGHNCTANNYLSNQTQVSPLITEAHAKWNKHTASDVQYAWHQGPRYINVTTRYKGENRQQFNLNYTYAKRNITVDNLGNFRFDKLESLKTGIALPIAKNWDILGGWRYNLTEDHAHTYFAGAEYDSCCWAIRTVGGQKLLYVDSDQKAHFDKIIYIQFLIKGLGALGSDPKALITAALPNYQNHFSKKA